jgi:hypothetical protein
MSSFCSAISLTHSDKLGSVINQDLFRSFSSSLFSFLPSERQHSQQDLSLGLDFALTPCVNWTTNLVFLSLNFLMK